MPEAHVRSFIVRDRVKVTIELDSDPQASLETWRKFFEDKVEELIPQSRPVIDIERSE